MHVVVCIKQVPDSSQIRVHPVTNTIMRQGVPAVINPYDLFSLEAALRLKDHFQAKITVLTMGPKMAADALRKCLGYGADQAILLTDRAFAGADTLATSYALASAIRKIGEDEPVDLVFCGKQTIDGDTAQVGPGVARRLALQPLTYIEKIEEINPEERRIIVHRRTETGVQVIQTALPCMITMLESADPIRFGSMDDVFRAARAKVTEWDHKAAGIEEITRCGLKGSPTVVKKVFAPQPVADPAKQIPVEERTPDQIVEELLSMIDLRTEVQA